VFMISPDDLGKEGLECCVQDDLSDPVGEGGGDHHPACFPCGYRAGRRRSRRRPEPVGLLDTVYRPVQVVDLWCVLTAVIGDDDIAVDPVRRCADVMGFRQGLRGAQAERCADPGEKGGLGEGVRSTLSGNEYSGRPSDLPSL